MMPPAREGLGSLLAALGRGRHPAAEEDEHTWNLLVQVLLPLVFVLTFVILITVHALAAVEGVIGTLIGEDPQLIGVELQQKILELQEQALLKALAEVKVEEERRLGLAQLPGSERVLRRGTTIDDPVFAALCQAGAQELGQRATYAGALYRRVLEKAGIEDHASLPVRRWNEASLSPVHEVEEQASDGRHVTARNRRLLHNLILDFLDGVEERIVVLQVGVVRDLFDDALASPDLVAAIGGADARLRELADPATPPERREELADELYRRLLRRWRHQLDAAGYVLLDESWRRLGR